MGKIPTHVEESPEIMNSEKLAEQMEFKRRRAALVAQAIRKAIQEDKILTLAEIAGKVGLESETGIPAKRSRNAAAELSKVKSDQDKQLAKANKTGQFHQKAYRFFWPYWNADQRAEFRHIAWKLSGILLSDDTEDSPGAAVTSVRRTEDEKADSPSAQILALTEEGGRLLRDFRYHEAQIVFWEADQLAKKGDLHRERIRPLIGWSDAARNQGDLIGAESRTRTALHELCWGLGQTDLSFDKRACTPKEAAIHVIRVFGKDVDGLRDYKAILRGEGLIYECGTREERESEGAAWTNGLMQEVGKLSKDVWCQVEGLLRDGWYWREEPTKSALVGNAWRTAPFIGMAWKLDVARRALEQAENLLLSGAIDDPRLLGHVQRTMASVYYSQKNPKEGAKYDQKAFESFTSDHSPAIVCLHEDQLTRLIAGIMVDGKGEPLDLANRYMNYLNSALCEAVQASSPGMLARVFVDAALIQERLGVGRDRRNILRLLAKAITLWPVSRTEDRELVEDYFWTVHDGLRGARGYRTREDFELFFEELVQSKLDTYGVPSLWLAGSSGAASRLFRRHSVASSSRR